MTAPRFLLCFSNQCLKHALGRTSLPSSDVPNIFSLADALQRESHAPAQAHVDLQDAPHCEQQKGLRPRPLRGQEVVQGQDWVARLRGGWGVSYGRLVYLGLDQAMCVHTSVVGALGL